MNGWDLWRGFNWGKLTVGYPDLGPRDRSQQLRPLAAPTTAETGKPGCEAAEACVETYGTLLTLADGLGGFGVLRLEKDRLERGAEAAEEFGSPEVARQMRNIADHLPRVRTPAEAARLAEDMKPVRDRSHRVTHQESGGSPNQNTGVHRPQLN